MPVRDLPPRPNLRQLRHQAKDLLRAFRRGDHSAVADFREYHPERVDPANATLADAQLVLARKSVDPETTSVREGHVCPRVSRCNAVGLGPAVS
jgi:hypothetical protein